MLLRKGCQKMQLGARRSDGGNTGRWGTDGGLRVILGRKENRAEKPGVRISELARSRPTVKDGTGPMKSVKSCVLFTVLTWLLMLTTAGVRAASDGKEENPSFKFSDVEYFYRWSKDDQYEFTPRGQEDLERWSDMMTIRRYRSVTDGDRLAAAANTVLENYKSVGAMVLRTDSVPRTADKPAEHLIVVLFPRKEYIEAAFARFKMVGGTGSSAIYCHRIYGEKAGNSMSAWLKANGPDVEKILMRWEGIPTVLKNVDKSSKR